MPEASKALAPPGPSSPCDQVSWSWAPVTPYPDPPSPPVTLSWPTDLLEPHPRVPGPSPPVPLTPLVPHGPGPLLSHLQSAALKAPQPSPPPPPQNKGLVTGQRLPVATSTLRPGTASCEAAAASARPPRRRRGGPHGSGSTTRRSAGVSAAETTRRRKVESSPRPLLLRCLAGACWRERQAVARRRGVAASGRAQIPRAGLAWLSRDAGARPWCRHGQLGVL